MVTQKQEIENIGKLKRRLFEYYGNTELAYKILEIRTRWLKYRRLK